MAYLEVEGLTKIYGAVTAVNGIDFSVERGKMIAILGGSGCGKTTTLRMIAGFTAPSAGVIRIDGKVIGGIPAHKRNIGMFFQNYALFPHLSTYDNIAFGLKLKKLKKAEIKRRVDEALQMVRLEGLEKRLPRELSGGQQQRVALARALVTEPALLLLDEPLSNLDAKLRADMQIELRRIHRATGITAIIVTHDQEEAMSLADRIIVMKDGDIRQNASPFLVYNRPVDPDIADFMGIANFICLRTIFTHKKVSGKNLDSMVDDAMKILSHGLFRKSVNSVTSKKE
jgi:ABC-type Fe3+/spermidine/putrescine transport system ATPase subunit